MTAPSSLFTNAALAVGTPVVSALVVGLALPGAAPADPATEEGAPSVTNWEVPWENTRPRDPYLGADGRLWFVGQRGDYLAALDLANGEFERHDLSPGTGPHNLIVASDGMVWFAGNRDAYIGRLNPGNGEIDRYDLPEETARDPHTLIFDSDENIWFTSQHANSIGHFNTRTGEARVTAVPTPRARPYGIVVDGDDRPWAVLLGTNKLATVDPETMELEEIELPREETRPRRLAATEDGRIWYVDFAAGHLGVYDPATREVNEWLSPSGESSRPYAMAADGRGNLWYVESGPTPHVLVGFDPETETFFDQTVLERADTGNTRHMVHQDGSLWFGLDSDHVTRVELP